MSRLWTKVRIAITPGHVAVSDGRTYRESAVATPGWAGALTILNGLLKDSGLKGRATVVLSHHFAHVHLLPSPPVFLKLLEMQGWVRDYLGRQYDESGMDRRVAWQIEPPGKPFLSSSMGAVALTELEEVIREAGLKAAAITPWLTVAWNRHSRRFGKGHHWYALVEPGRLMLAGVDGGNIGSVRTAMMPGDPVADLADLIKRESLLAGHATPAPIWVDSVMVRADWRNLGAGSNVHALASGSESLAFMLGI